MHVEVVSLDNMKLYEKDTDFVEALKSCKEPWSTNRTPYLHFHIQEGFLLKHHKLCIPQSSLRLNIIQELHRGGLGGHFGVDKTKPLLDERYFWSSINKDIKKFIECCRICQLAKGRS
jgi:hypothetical protein